MRRLQLPYRWLLSLIIPITQSMASIRCACWQSMNSSPLMSSPQRATDASLCSLPFIVQGPGSSSPSNCSKQDHLGSRSLRASISHTNSVLASPSHYVAKPASSHPSSSSSPSSSAWGKVLCSLYSTPTKAIKATQLVTRSQALCQHYEYAHSSASSRSNSSSARASLAQLWH